MITHHTTTLHGNNKKRRRKYAATDVETLDTSQKNVVVKIRQEKKWNPVAVIVTMNHLLAFTNPVMWIPHVSATQQRY